MGAASCKNSKSYPESPQKEDKKNITIGVFGLDDAGKTSTVKAIEGDPTEDVQPTMGSNSKMVPFPMNGKNAAGNTNKNQRVRMIDVSGEKKFRQNSWPQFYDEIHGLIFVFDASEKNRLKENQETLENLLGNVKLKDKPILILANKQDQRGALSNENDLRRRLNIEKLKAKHKIELCTALPQDDEGSVDESIRKGFSWLIRTIDENYTQLNLRITQAKTNRTSRKTNQYDSDGNASDDKYSKRKTTSFTNKNTDYHSRMTTEKLPSIFPSKTKTKAYSDNDDDDDDVYRSKSSIGNDFNKKKKVTGPIKNNDAVTKRSSSNEPKPFRSTYEPFPEETPWSASSPLKLRKSDDMLSKLHSKSSIVSDSKRRNMSPLVHDTKSYTNGLLSKRNNGSDDEDDLYKQQKPKLSDRFDNSTFSTNKFSSSTKKPLSSFDDDDDDIYSRTNNRLMNTTSKKSSNTYDDDDDEDNYSKTATKTNKNYDFEHNKSYQRPSSRLNLDQDYRGTSPKITTRSRHDDDDDNRPLSSSRKKTTVTYEDDDDDDENNNYSKSKSITRSTFSNDYSTSKFNDNSYSSPKSTIRWKHDNEDRPHSSSKPMSSSKFEDDDYPNSTKKPNYSSSYNANNTYGGSSSRSRIDDHDFFT
ncbi:unnamed protein product [Rotaria magnacalcarata]|uniref:ADP-ribosylation factor-like protein 13B n=1 Tax=Rotaria magnacalcarata TaxID=392030 RepID=A0A819P7T3_9BILA|nr:unnamed protein product [Rotaria magnacalcarata]CAF2234135.1 unnamed protein product [Rotaria magnacalcarata]CAF4009462.1 unnamed protein product [Rotaria magnacalcarata]CAF4178621.1 unnamed protein product [Rotaria magnacalcarata]